MRNHLKYVSILSLSLLVAAVPARAEDNVYVDLSVLNGLQQSVSPAMPASQPLFPVVTPKKDPIKKAKPAIRHKKRPAVKAKVAKTKIAPVVKTEEAVKNAEPKVVKPVEEPKLTSQKEEPASAVAVEVKAENVAEVYAPQVENTPQVSSAPVEEKSVVETTVLPSPVVPQPLVSETPVTASEPQTNEVETGLGVKTDLITPAGNQVYAPSVATSPVATQLEENVAPSMESQVNVASSPMNNKIKFTEEESELTDADKKQIDGIIAGFQNSHDNKIAITAYNVDGGANAFRRKRTSLNRAVNIRTYLLSQGYKNYSIKIVNVPENDERVDTVEIKELL